jgi:hypothetical protein
MLNILGNALLGLVFNYFELFDEKLYGIYFYNLIKFSYFC